MNYYISDLHIGCVNSHDKRTLEHDKLLEDRWNAVITNKDNVYILGDIGRTGSRKDNDYLIQKIAVLKGRKHLICGNHDDLRDERLRQLFIDIKDYNEFIDNIDGRSYKVVLSHYPILCWSGQHKGAILLYGHTHNSAEDTIFQVSIATLNEYFEIETEGGRDDCPQCAAYNVGAMKSYIDYCPKTLTQIIKNRNNYIESEIKNDI